MALIKCPDCNKDVSSNAPACPNCGAPIAESKEQTNMGGYIPYSDHEVSVMLSQKNRTSHVLHLILSIITFGFWIIIWIIVSLGNSIENSYIDKKIQKGKKI